MNISEAMKRIAEVGATLDDDDPDKVVMLNVEGDYSALMDWAIRKRTEALAFENANLDLADDYNCRAKRLGQKADKMTDIVGSLMACAGERSYKGAYGTVSVRVNRPRPVIVDDALVPDAFKKTYTSIDKTAINEAVAAGTQIPGVAMSNGSETIVIRSK